MIKCMMDSIQPTSSTGSDYGGISPLMSFVMGNDTNYKQKFYKPLLKRPSAGITTVFTIYIVWELCTAWDLIILTDHFMQ